MTVTQFVREFKIGSAVAIDIDSGSQKGMPFRRFQGLTGKILRKQGRAYVVEIFDGQKSKKVIALPEHLRAA
jgi:large subunit ribosomal protein L21e